MSVADKTGKAAATQAMPSGTTSGTPQLLLGHHLKQLKLPTILREYDKVAREAAREGIDHATYLLRLVELELIDRERRVVERRIRQARFPAVKSLDTFDFTAIPSLNKMLLKLQRDLGAVKLLIIDELGYVPLSTTGAELLFEVFSQRYERGSTIVTSNLPFEEWTSVFGAERLTGALLDRLTHHVHILSMNGESYRLIQSTRRRKPASAGAEDKPAEEIVDPLTGEIAPT